MHKKKKENPNIRCAAWGELQWYSMIFIALGYTPTKKTKKIYKDYFMNLGKVLPCKLCRKSYMKFIKIKPFTNKVMSTKENLVYNIFDIKNLVNKKIKKKLLPKSKYKQKYNYFNQFRAGKCSKKLKGCVGTQKGRIPKKCKVKVLLDKSRHK